MEQKTKKKGLVFRLFSKTRLAYGTYAPVIAGALTLFAVLLLVIIPARSAEAGFFSEIIKFFVNADVGDRRAEFIEETKAASNAAPVLAAVHSTERTVASELPDLSFVQESALVASANPLGTIQERDNTDYIFLYTVKPGDTPSSIAKTFDITVNTILWANNLKSASSIKVGDQLVILPVTGVTHVVKKGDTIESIARKYKQESAEILAFNGIPVGSALEVGKEIIIPDGELAAPTPSSGSGSSRITALPQIQGYFARPIHGGRKSQGLHGRNGVDLADSCGLPIVASAAGTVLISRETGWNGGFGKYIVINHPNGTQTVYAHNSKNMVTTGEVVTQGQIIGMIGNTGNTRGATGCHVHFEIHGARNPF